MNMLKQMEQKLKLWILLGF